MASAPVAHADAGARDRCSSGWGGATCCAMVDPGELRFAVDYVRPQGRSRMGRNARHGPTESVYSFAIVFTIWLRWLRSWTTQVASS